MSTYKQKHSYWNSAIIDITKQFNCQYSVKWKTFIWSLKIIEQGSRALRGGPWGTLGTGPRFFRGAQNFGNLVRYLCKDEKIFKMNW